MDSIVCFASTYPLIAIYPVDSAIQPSNNGSLECKWVPTNFQKNPTKLFLGVTCAGLLSIPSRRSNSTPKSLHVMKTGITSGFVDKLA